MPPTQRGGLAAPYAGGDAEQDRNEQSCIPRGLEERGSPLGVERLHLLTLYPRGSDGVGFVAGELVPGHGLRQSLLENPVHVEDGIGGKPPLPSRRPVATALL